MKTKMNTLKRAHQVLVFAIVVAILSIGVGAVIHSDDRLEFVDKCVVKLFGTLNGPTGGIRDYCKALERQR